MFWGTWALVGFHPHLHPSSMLGSLPWLLPLMPQQQDQKGTSSFQLVSLIRRRKSLQNNHQTIRDGTTESTRGEGALKAASAGAERCGAGTVRAGPAPPLQGRPSLRLPKEPAPPSQTGVKKEKEPEPVAKTRGFTSFGTPGSISAAQLGLLRDAARRGKCQPSSPKQKPPAGHGRNNPNCSEKPFRHQQVEHNICAQRCPVPWPG